MWVKRRCRFLAAGAVMFLVAVGTVSANAAHAAVTPVRHVVYPAWAVAFQANDSTLWTESTAYGATKVGVTIRTGTRPSIALLNGGYGVAYAGTDGSLHVYGSHSRQSRSLHLGMLAGTSPSYTRLVGTQSAAIAIQSNSGELWATSTTYGAQNLRFAMQAGTSPAIVGLSGGGFEIAYEGDDGSLHVYSSITKAASSLHLGMGTTSSPGIAALPSGGFVVAIEANTNLLWSWTSGVGAKYLDTGMRPSETPSVAATKSGYEVAVVASSQYLVTATATGLVGTRIVPHPFTSPSIAALADGRFEIAYEATNANLYTYDAVHGAVDRHLGMLPGSDPSIAG